MEAMKWYQQGDVAIKPATPPKGDYRVIKGGALVASAVTKHTHRAVGKGVKVVNIGNAMFIIANKPFKVTHEEHKTIDIPSGTYQVDEIKEYDHFAEEARRVAD